MFSFNQKVVPVSKSTGMTLEESVWSEAEALKQPFLYVKGAKDIDGEKVYSCSELSSDVTGDLFLEADLIPYVEHEAPIELTKVSLQELIDLHKKGVLMSEDKFYVRRVKNEDNG